MNVLEKFYSDALRIAQKTSGTEFKPALADLFIDTIRRYDKTLLPLAEASAQYWLNAYRQEERTQAADWFYKVFALFDGAFDTAMDFSDEDWEELHALVSAAAEYLDMNTVQSIMSVMVERHKVL